MADPTCTDSQKNGSETDVDCGGSLCPKCPPGKACSAGTDCTRGPCQSGICGCTADTCATTNSCAASIADGCGSNLTCTGACAGGQTCFNDKCCTPTDCGSRCGAQTDGCGVPLDCGICADGQACKTNTDCANAICQSGVCVSCFDGKKNNGETGVDCGGANCAARCPSGQGCASGGDCAGGTCCSLLEIFSGCFGKPDKTCK
ncbi:MAG: hypothetical protein FJ104_12635 [Deltaproteobacteria bacterium]|nr:hypothetical protein [Deltaproteobacteria bacterium]